MDFWETWTFADLLAEPVRNGIYKKKEFHGKGQKVINMGELFSYDFISNQEMRRIELNDRELANYLVKDGDLLFARRSFVLEGSGKCSLVVQPSENTTFESSIIRARPKPEWTDPHFYYYLFRSPQGRALISSIATRTAVSGIRGSELALLKVPKPPLPTQRKIAAVLSAYDDLIENNTRRIKILEEMASAIYREWFVEFRFPGHEQGEMVESELGLIPQGWEVKKVKEIVKRLKAGQTYRQTDVKPVGKVIVVDQSREDFLGFHDNEPDHNAFPESPIIIFGDHTCKMQLMITPFSLGPNVVPFITKGEMPISYLFFGVSNLVETREYKRHWTELNNKEVAIGDSDTRERFSDFATLIFEQIEILRQKNQNLRQTRDLLLPKLISGEIDVSELDIGTD